MSGAPGAATGSRETMKRGAMYVLAAGLLLGLPLVGAWAVGLPLDLLLEPVARFQMRGLGYVSPKWGHGLYHGPLAVEREDIVLDSLDPLAPAMDNLHVQMVTRVTTSAGETGIGAFEQLILGPYDPLGLTGYLDHG